MVAFWKKYHLNILEFLMALLIMLNANSVFSKAIYENYRLEYIGGIIAVILCLATLKMAMDDKSQFKKWFAMSVVYVGIILFYTKFHSVMNMKTTIGVLILYPPCITLYLVQAKKLNRHMNIMKYYADICLVLALVSLVYWILGPMTRWINPYAQYDVQWGETRKFNTYSFLYYTQSWQSVSMLGMKIRRNVGFFCEGPMFSLALTLSFAYDLYVRGKKKIDYLEGTKFDWINRILMNDIINPRAAFLLLVNLTTFSVTGIMISIMLLFAKFYFQFGKSGKAKKIKNIILVVSFVLTVALLVVIFFLKSSSMSWRTRVDDYFAGLKTFIHHPVLGAGIGNIGAIQENMSEFRRNNTGTSNSITTILGEGGIVLGMIYMLPMIPILYRTYKDKKRKNTFPVFAVFLVEFIVTYFPFTFLLLLFVAYGYAEIIELKWKLKAGVKK